ncbi:hypothetical protein RBH94_11370 [Aestuariibaculum sp. YM273]|uniref:hypothetical protein n=1 Tax=Aestuariibaculum sp. YM273 TaxID=3070659 RepID=UPI0027DB5651|nr:hypothetical protein [Aestuariibaculum sp. YM273]WMI64657.1 hypothetical protein RBH94_11370 [Aestuariibaculum sp. YM273]
MKYSTAILTFIFMFLLKSVAGQVGYQKDSLQIKVYTEVEYQNYWAQDIRVKKVFCDYCTKFQKEQIGNEALRRTYLVRNNKKFRMPSGVFRHALYIRIAKKDFARLREDNMMQDSVLTINEQRN